MIKLECPEGLVGEARRTWERIAQDLALIGKLKAGGKRDLAVYCEAHARWMDANRKLKVASRVMMIGGKNRANPLIKVGHDAVVVMLRMTRKLFLSPMSRGEDEK